MVNKKSGFYRDELAREHAQRNPTSCMMAAKMFLSTFPRQIAFWGLLFWLVAAAPVTTPVLWAAPQLQDEQPLVYVLTFSGTVTPVLESYLQDAIEQAGQTGANAIVLRLDTPGGSVEVTKRIMQRMLASPIPIVV